MNDIVEFCQCSGIGFKKAEKENNFQVSAFIPAVFILDIYNDDKLQMLSGELLTKYWGMPIYKKKKKDSMYINCYNCFKAPENYRYFTKICNSITEANRFKKKILKDIDKIQK